MEFHTKIEVIDDRQAFNDNRVTGFFHGMFEIIESEVLPHSRILFSIFLTEYIKIASPNPIRPNYGNCYLEELLDMPELDDVTAEKMIALAVSKLMQKLTEESITTKHAIFTWHSTWESQRISNQAENQKNSKLNNKKSIRKSKTNAVWVVRGRSSHNHKIIIETWNFFDPSSHSVIDKICIYLFYFIHTLFEEFSKEN